MEKREIMSDSQTTNDANAATGGATPGDPAVLTAGDAGDGDLGDITPPAANTWWKFESQEEAETWANNMVTKRLSRVQKTKIEPLEQMRATLEAEVARLKPFEEAAMTEDEKRQAREAAKDEQIAELLSFKQTVERQQLVNEVLAEVGVDPKFAKFVNTDGDADSIRASAEELLNALSEGGLNAGKRTPKPKAPKADDADGGDGNGRGNGGGGNGDESDEALIAAILEETAKTRANGGIRFA
ncbi:scaffolding protein [Mycobacterium phage Reindeer]|uniref:Scaffolding protein n=1 Tax=Mycobacterium phage Reindeer TaxID=2762283 RepID=A0A7G8LHV3_9CAUD|nr:head scaffolding protein [Mycobacterium phage Reindeer]QNJ56825.1 scaffolding protein [Mycobacterium phage Reindeer]